MNDTGNAKRAKIREKQKKLVKFLLILIAILTFVTITFKQFADETLGIKNIQTMIGAEYSGGEALTVKENLILRAAADAYIQTIHSGDLNRAYASLLPKYKEIVSKEVYSEAIEKIGTENFVIESISIEQLAEKLFAFHLTIKNDNNLELLLVLDGENYYIVPEPFLEYNEVNKAIKKDGVEYTLKNYQVDVDRCIFDMTLKNTKNEAVEIIEVKMKNQNDGVYYALNQEITLEPNETKDISFLVETRLDFPTQLQIIRKGTSSIRIYTFELD